MALNTLTLANSSLSGSGTVAVNGLTAGSMVTLTNNPEGAFFFDGANLIYNLASSYPRKLAPVLLEQLGPDQGQTVFAVNVAGAFAPGPTTGNSGVDAVARAAAADAKANPTLTQASVTAAGDKTARDAAVDAKANPTVTSAAIIAAIPSADPASSTGSLVIAQQALALASKGAGRIQNMVTGIGDSRVDAFYLNTDQLGYNARSPVNVAKALTG